LISSRSSFHDTKQEDISRDICYEQLLKNGKNAAEYGQANSSVPTYLSGVSNDLDFVPRETIARGVQIVGWRRDIKYYRSASTA